jgi:hypothetical protein
MDECAQILLKNPFFSHATATRTGGIGTMGSRLRVNTGLTRSVVELPELTRD